MPGYQANLAFQREQNANTHLGRELFNEAKGFYPADCRAAVGKGLEAISAFDAAGFPCDDRIRALLFTGFAMRGMAFDETDPQFKESLMVDHHREGLRLIDRGLGLCDQEGYPVEHSMRLSGLLDKAIMELYIGEANNNLPAVDNAIGAFTQLIEAREIRFDENVKTLAGDASPDDKRSAQFEAGEYIHAISKKGQAQFSRGRLFDDSSSIENAYETLNTAVDLIDTYLPISAKAIWAHLYRGDVSLHQQEPEHAWNDYNKAWNILTELKKQDERYEAFTIYGQQRLTAISEGYPEYAQRAAELQTDVVL